MAEPFVADLLAFGLPVHVVLDGAIVPDIEKHLERHETKGRPLFRETMDRETVIAGPWLLSPGLSHHALALSVSAARDAGQGVFWLGDQGEEALFRHLRKLNAARMPAGNIVYFRHYDSDVLAAVIPLLDEVQAAHLFGPTSVIVLIGGCGDGATVTKPNNLPKPLAGPISFYSWQTDVLDERQRVISRRKIARLLRNEYPEQVQHLDDDRIYDRIVVYERQSQAINLTSEEALANWVRLNMETKDGVSRNVALKSQIANLPASQANDIFVREAPDLISAYRQLDH